MKTTEQRTASCHHCGETCENGILHLYNKDFCCNGCLLVYEVLQENDLCSYYEIADNPGTRQPSTSKEKNRFDYLDDSETASKLLDFNSPTESHITFNIPQIHCASCIWLLEKLPMLHTGIISGRVDFLKRRVQVKFLHSVISLKELVQLLSKIGYEPSLNWSDLQQKTDSPADRVTLYRLAVAGLCFGNMMFFSLPEYFSEADLLGEHFRDLFSYLNVLLALPVFFYSAAGYHKSAWVSLRNGTINMDFPIVLGIFALFFYSLYTIFVLDEAGYMDTLGGLLFFLLIGKVYQQKTFDTLTFDRDYKSYFPMSVTKIIQGTEQVIPLGKLKVGDLIQVRNNELVPSDSMLLEGRGNIDFSFVTGEEVPIEKGKGELIYAGGRQKGGTILLCVQKLPSQGYLTSLWNNETFEKGYVPTLESLATKISSGFTVVILFIAFASLLFWSFQDVGTGLKAFTSVLIIACPCALAMSTPFTLGNTLRIFGRGKLYLKNAGVIEKMALIDTLIFDKTGTLTAPANASVEFVGEELSPESRRIVKAMVCHSTHPLSNRINSWLEEEFPAFMAFVEEIPGRGLKGFYKGQEFLLGSTDFVGGVSSIQRPGGNKVHLAVEGQSLGYYYILSGLREGVESVISAIGKDKSIHLLSGDNDHERENFMKIMPDTALNFNQSPIDKLEYVKCLNQKGGKTLMLGDGLNDAGALQESHVGIALTEKITHFSPASDAIMDAEAFAKLPAFLDFSKTSRRIIKASFALSFAYNLIGISFAVQGLLSPVLCAVLMPLSSISVILFTTLCTNYLAYKKGLIDKIPNIWK